MPDELLQLEPPPVAAVATRIEGTLRLEAVPGGWEARFLAMGTTCRVRVGGSGLGKRGARTVTEELVRWVALFEARYSRFLDGSWISQLNARSGGGWVAVDPELERLLALGGEMAFLTRGIVDPTLLPLMRLWDWRTARIPTEADVARARERTGWQRVLRRPGALCLPVAGMALDLGGYGKEYAVDQAVALLAQRGLTSILVDFGGDVRVAGVPPDGRPAWGIGLEDSGKPGVPWGTVVLREGAVASSGNYLRKFEIAGRVYGHILDPRTGMPVDNGVRSVHVVASSCSQAGMLGTAALVLGPLEGLRLLESAPGAEGCLVTGAGMVCSRRFHEYLTT